MKVFYVAICSNKPNKFDELTKYGSLADYTINAESEEEARGLAFKKFCEENPDRSHMLCDYTSSVGYSEQ